MSMQSTRGEWVEYTANDVCEFLKQHVQGLDFDKLVSLVDSVGRELYELREEAVSYLTALNDASDDSYIARLLEQTTKRLPRGIDEYVRAARPTISLVCRDSLASSAGLQIPPHINLKAQTNAIEDRLTFARDFAAIARRAASHLSRRRSANREAQKPGTKVFIGHGRSKLWKDLKDFINDRLTLDYDEFNRVTVAGTTNIARLQQMLDDAAIAFLVLTAEDEMADGELRARENVVHEAGLFQGRLGFMKAIVLLEEGCNEFSNIHGLGQIRFSKGNIGAAFEEIRLVLERERILGEQS